jgi:hypothetical protein
VLPRGRNFGRKTQKGQKIVWGLTRGSPPFYLTNAGGEPRVKLGVWRPEMWALTTGQSPPPCSDKHSVCNTVMDMIVIVTLL